MTNPSATYLALETVNVGDGVPYINPCTTDPIQSTILGNLDPSENAPSAGSHMPQDNPQLPDADDLAVIATWVACGAPFN